MLIPIHLRQRLPVLRADANRVLVFHRWVPGEGRDVIIAINLSEHTWPNYQLGLPRPGRWEEAFNSDIYDNWVNPWRQGNGGGVFADGGPMHDFQQSANVALPVNSICVFVS